MLPWLIIPLIILWALSQLLPPGFRFEVTSPRLACVGVLLFSLGWYEILIRRLSTRRSLMLHEKRKIEAQEAAKWRKEAIRRCRNCLTAYKDQKPVGGKFMCTYCGHVSKRPALDVPAGASSAGIGQFIGRKDLRMQGNLSSMHRMFENELWPGIEGVGSNGEHCIRHNSAGVLIVFRLVSFVAYCIWWACSKMWREGMSDGERLRAERKGGQRKHESKVEKLRRKAEEKRLARLEKEQMEAEERMQREEVARLVDERRKQRVQMMGAEKDNGTEIIEQEMERRRKKKANEKGKDAGGGRSRNASQDDPRRRKNKGKKDKRPEECLKTVGMETGSKSEDLFKTGVNPGKGSSLKTTSVVLESADKEQVNNGNKFYSESSSMVSSLTEPQEEPTNVQTPSYFDDAAPVFTLPLSSPLVMEQLPAFSASLVTASKLPPLPSSFSSPDYENASSCLPSVNTSGVSSPFQGSSLTSCSVSRFLLPPAVTSDAPAFDRWGTDLLPKSTWQMWDAPNLELPILTQSLANDVRPLPPVSLQPKTQLTSLSLLSSSGLPSAVGNIPTVPISNNLWSNYHAFESTRRIWEDLDLQSEVTPPEFIDCITQEIMKDPVIAADGHSYERSAIEEWLRTHNTSPKTGELLPALACSASGVDKSLRCNHNLRGQIIEYRECMERGDERRRQEKGKDAGGGKSRNASQDDSKRSKDKGKKDKRPEECTKGLKTVGIETGIKSEDLFKTGVNPGKGSSLKTSCVVRESAVKEQVNNEKDVEHPVETSSTQEIPVSSLSMVSSLTEPLEEPSTVQTPSYFGSFDDAAPVFTSLLSVNSSGVSSPFEGSSVDSCSVYSTFLPPPADAPAFDRWGTDLLPKSTWEMWDAPNLDFPRLTQSLANDGRPLPPVSSQPKTQLSSSLLSSSGLPNAVGNIPSVPISNNLWSNYHAFESTRRIWEDLDLQSEVTPPEFICCITQEVMKDPVIAADGHSYERAAIEEWFRTHNTSPKTGEVLPALPNHNHRECMERG